MSILDGPFQDRATMQNAAEFAQRMMQEALPELDEESRRLLEITSDGTTLADALGITREQRNALLEMGCRLIQVGQLDKAADVLLRLNQLDPYDERVNYSLGVLCQTRGELFKAAQMYLQFLALDATNPTGYLRLGECLLAAKEYDEAYSAFDMAKEFAQEGKGEPGNLQEALKMLEIPEIAAAGQRLKH